MPAFLTDPDIPAADLRQRLYSGDLIILTRLQALAEFVDYMRDELTKLFAPHDPEHAHEHIDKVEMAKLLGEWKPRWIHAERSRELVRAIIAEAGFEPAYTHYDVPKPRTSFPVGHLTTGIAFAFPWHRDVWYSAPEQQINWWLPVFPVRETNAMSFDLASFAQAVPNTSGEFDYYENNARHGQVRGQGGPGPATGGQSHAGRGRDPPPGSRRGPALLRRPAAHVHPEHLGAGQVQRRLPHRGHEGPDGAARRPAGRRRLHWHGGP